MKHESATRPVFLSCAACLLIVAALSGCATHSPPVALGQIVHSRSATPKAAAVIRTAQVLVGYPYKWGGYLPETGFDCSGLIWFVYHQNGVSLPRVSWKQFGSGAPIDRNDIRPGDLIFHKVDKSGKSLHVGIVTDRATFVHAPSSGKRVMESSLNNPFWAEHYLGARRVL